MKVQDRVGLGWRGELAAAIYRHLDEIEVLEVIAEDWLQLPRRRQRALAAIAAERPLLLHGVAMGLASSIPVEQRRLERMARLCEAVRPAAWSEHLAFVRAGGVEIGHLAAPPRTAATVDGACANIAYAARLIGAMSALENIATLVEPPASDMDEAAWTGAILDGSGATMLLDLHNLYANALNFGWDPAQLLRAMPLQKVSMVHLSGGRWIGPPQGRRRLLDDHLHDVPEAVFDLLERLAAWTTRPLQVLIERDGNYPEFPVLLRQVRRARSALQRGRAAGVAREAA
jgi:uncharacterized protein (UPF0276 family)